jgi:hypothetical protein
VKLATPSLFPRLGRYSTSLVRTAQPEGRLQTANLTGDHEKSPDPLAGEEGCRPGPWAFPRGSAAAATGAGDDLQKVTAGIPPVHAPTAHCGGSGTWTITVLTIFAAVCALMTRVARADAACSAATQTQVGHSW